MKKQIRCPDCGNVMFKSGFVWSGRKKVQRWKCNRCGRTTIKLTTDQGILTILRINKMENATEQAPKILHKRIGNLKWCFVCRQYKNVQEFGLDRAQPDGHVNLCKACHGKYQKAYQAKYYREHREDLLPAHNRSAKLSYRRNKEV